MELSRIAPNRAQFEVSPKSALSPDEVADAHSASRILYRDDFFFVLNKPHDVRMNGDFDVTIEKIVKHHLSCGQPADWQCPSLKWIHQLDYATSGVLW